MDPISIVGVASAAVQFADFGSRLLNESIRIYKGVSGAELKVVDISRISHDLSRLSGAIRESIASASNESHAILATTAALLEECRRSEAICQEILQSVAKIQDCGIERLDFSQPDPVDQNGRSRKGGGGKKSKIDSFRKALRLVRSDGQIDSLDARILAVKSKLMFALISNLWYASPSGPDLIVPTSHKFRERSLGPAAAQGMDGPPTFHQTLIQQVNSKYDAGESTQLPSGDSIFAYQTAVAGRDNQVQWSGKDPQSSNAFCTKILLESLRFDALEHRSIAIPSAHEETFGWIFKQPRRADDAEQSQMWSSFPDWLETDSDNVYWITGKPGSGKSTMMKYLSNQEQMQLSLEKWAKPRRVITANFYSWSAGTGLQKSQEGLLRTLCYQILQQAPNIAPRLFPGRWAMLKLFDSSATSQLPPWTWRELFDGLVSLDPSSHHDFALAIFVDGLDEFDGDHRRLIELIKKFHSRPGIKVCISSRPWNEFRDAFASCPQLRMEMLTWKDIEIYVGTRLRENLAFAELREEFPTEADALMDGVVEKAKGVFLWVSVVTNALLIGLTDGDTLEDLQRMLDDLPSDLAYLYTSLWEKIKPNYRSEGARLILLYQAYTQSPILNATLFSAVQTRMPAETLWHAEGGGSMSPELIVRTLKRRLNSRTMGLLEVTSANVIEYLHRTVRDWIETVWAEIEAQAPEDFDASLDLLGAQASMVSCWCQYVCPDEANCECRKLWQWLFQCIYHASRIADKPQNYGRLCEILDRLEISFQTFCSSNLNHNLTLALPPWNAFAPNTMRKLGFAALAADYGAFTCVKVRVASDPDYPIINTEENILSHLILAPCNKGTWEGKPDLATAAQYLRNLNVFISIHLQFKPVQRFRVANDLLRIASEKARGSGAEQGRGIQILSEYVAEKYQSKQWNGLFGIEIPVGHGSEQQTMPYGLAVSKLLESHCPKKSFIARARVFRRAKKTAGGS